MYLEVYGPEDGEPIVFLHGSMVAGWMWLGQVQDLPGYRCFLPDLPGLGNSGDTPWKDLSNTCDLITDLIVKNCPDGKAHVVGLSLGGIVALHLAAKRPDVIKSLIVSGVPYGKFPLPLRLLNKIMLKLYGRPWGARLIANLFGIPRDESMDAFLLTAMQTDLKSLEMLTREVLQEPIPQAVDGIQAQTLVVTGKRDTKLAINGVLYLSDIMPNAAGYFVPNVGHQWNAEDQKLFSKMVRLWVDSRSVCEEFEPV